MSGAKFQGFFRIKGGVDAAVNDNGAAFPAIAADFHAAQCVSGMDADPDYVAGLNGIEVQMLQSFVGDDGIAIFGRCRGG